MILKCQPLQPQRQIYFTQAKFSRKTGRFSCVNAGTAVALWRVSGGYSGPASRSGVPLEHPPYHTLPAWLQGESQDTPCPAILVASVSVSVPSRQLQFPVLCISIDWKLKTGNGILTIVRAWSSASARRGFLPDAGVGGARTRQ